MAWETNGNANTNPPSDFLGTTDNQPIVIKTDGAEHVRVDTSGNVGIGTAYPAAPLDVNGAMALRGPLYTFDGATQRALIQYESNGLIVRDGAVGSDQWWMYCAPGQEVRFLDGTNNDSNARFIIGSGNVGLGTSQPAARLSVVLPGTTEIVGSAASTTLRTSSGAVGQTPGSEAVMASFGAIVDGNNVSLGIRTVRIGQAGQGWTGSVIDLTMDVDDTPGAGGGLFIYSNGNIGPRRGIQFPDGSSQSTAQVRGPAGPTGPQGPAGPQGPPGVSPPPQVFLGQNTAGGGFIGLLGPGGRQTCQLTGIQGAPNNGVVAVTDAAGAAAGRSKARMYVDLNGNGTIEASVKNFRVPHPNQPDTDIVYACIEGPEAAAYVRGTARLNNGQSVIPLPEHFTSVVVPGSLTVLLTPLSTDSAGLAVVEKGVSEIRIRELHGGTGSYEFDWEVKGVRKDHANYQVLRPRSEVALSQNS